MGGHSVRLPQGEAFWDPRYPDLYFLNGICRLLAPGWSVADFERAVRDTMPGVRGFRAYSRDPHTIATLGKALGEAGYRHEVRVAMVQAFSPSAAPVAGDAPEAPFGVVAVENDRSWADFEESIRTDGREHRWPPAMVDQFLELCHWSAANTPARYYLGSLGGRAAAHVGLFQHGSTAYLHALYTHPDARRRGVGRALTLAMRAEAETMGCDRLTLQCVEDGYLPGYYARLGFRPVGEQHIWTGPR